MPIHKPRKLPTVALVGRTNVGKSSLWNRLTDQGMALVSSSPHTTRDRQYGRVVWRGDVFELVDTGGMDTESDQIGEGIKSQAERAIKEADLVLFVIDAKTGILPQDKELALRAKELNKKIWLVANKVDKLSQFGLTHQAEMFNFPLKDAMPISASSGLGIGELLDKLLEELKNMGKPAVPVFEIEPLRIAVVGRPNVGKSSLVNAILGEERVIVSPIAHTTREPQDTHIVYNDRDIILVDTAGMRKKSHITDRIEEAGIQRNEKAIDDADIALLVIDVTVDPTAQDRHLAGYLQESHKGLIIVANKWDLIPDRQTYTAKEMEGLIRQLFPFLSWAPIIFTSAKDKIRTTTLIDAALDVQVERHRHIDYNAINRLLKTTIKAMRPLASYGANSPRIYDVAQVDSAPPTFLVTVHGDKDNLHPNWLKFFQKRIREKFNFTGTPIVVKVQHLPVAKSKLARNVNGPGMEAVAGKIREKKKMVNLTMRRQKGR